MLSQDLLKNNLLDTALKYIENVLNSGKSILVHWPVFFSLKVLEFGVSRSVTIITAYLMKKHKWNPSEAILFIQINHPIASQINLLFVN
uniref:Dual specificity phosphatase catalytic domain-containing protein n=1 Tax=Panagrolaimus sp. PS1159 TaxID=55785 RepID=A0AC35G887_9BILA